MTDAEYESDGLHCEVCGEPVEDREAGREHVKDEHGFLELLNHQVWEATPPVDGDCNV